MPKGHRQSPVVSQARTAVRNVPDLLPPGDVLGDLEDVALPDGLAGDGPDTYGRIVGLHVLALRAAWEGYAAAIRAAHDAGISWHVLALRTGVQAETLRRWFG